MLKIRSLSIEKHKEFSELVLGFATCPFCGQDDVKVINDRGPQGDPSTNYLENHSPQGSDILCDGSEELLAKL